MKPAPPTIWIVDDDPYYSPALQELLEKSFDAEVSHFAKGCDVIAHYDKQGPPQAVVLDMMIPFDDADFAGALPPLEGEARGVKVARLLIERGLSAVRIVGITALREKHHQPMRALGVKHVLVKPAPVTEILSAIRSACRTP